MRVRVRSRREQSEQGDGNEVAERRLRPANLRSTVEPGRVDEEDDGRDQDLAEPTDDEEQRCENDAPEAQLRQADRGRFNQNFWSSERKRCGSERVAHIWEVAQKLPEAHGS